MVAGAIRPGEVEISEVDESHLGALTEFFQEVWDPNATVDRVRAAREAAAAANPVDPGRPPPRFLFLSEGRALGHVGTIPVRLWIGGEESGSYWVKGLMVLPQHRDGPVGFLLLKEAIRHLDTALTLVVAEAPRKLFGALGFEDIGVVPNWVSVLRPGRFLRKLDLDRLGLSSLPTPLSSGIRAAQRMGLAPVVGWAGGMAARAWTLVRGSPPRRFQIQVEERIDPQACDELWQRVRGSLRAAPVRDGNHLVRTYEERGRGYRFVTVREPGGGMVALAVVGEPRRESDPRLAGIRVAALSDLVFRPDDPGAGLSALAEAEGVGRSFDADALLGSFSHALFPALLRRRAFVRVPGNLHLMVRTGPDSPPLPSNLGDWWVTRGDGGADEGI